METKDKQEIFQRIKTVLQEYDESMVGSGDDEKYELYTGKPMELGGRQYPTMYFAATKIQKGFVGFYYMPIYMNPEAIENIPANLRKLLKGKTCFRITKLDDALLHGISELLKRGFKVFKANNWLK